MVWRRDGGDPRTSRGGAGGLRRGGQGGRAGKAGSARKGPTIGSGGQGRRRLEGRAATPPAEQRPGHPSARRRDEPSQGYPSRQQGTDGRVGRADGRGDGHRDARGAARGRTGRGARPDARRDAGAFEVIAGRNAVVEALRAAVPATALFVATGIDPDDRTAEALTLAGRRAVSVVEVGRHELDRITAGALHQGVALQVPPYQYLHPDDLLARAQHAGVPLIVALDGVTDPRNLGAVLRSAAAFGAHGVLVPERRAAGLTAAAWKASAGAAARLPVASATNLVRTLKAYAAEGLTVVGLAAAGEVILPELELATDPLVLVVGSEDRGLSRLVGETCDLRVAIPMAAGTESLNASVAAAVALYHVASRRSASGSP